MNNYVTYPIRQFTRGSCIIVFGDRKYSLCYLSGSQKRYLLESAYLEGAQRIDVKTNSGKDFSLSKEQFVDWLKSGFSEPQVDPADQIQGNVCPQCGKVMRLRAARRGPNVGKQFWGCSGYPECRFTKDYSES